MLLHRNAPNLCMLIFCNITEFVGSKHFMTCYYKCDHFISFSNNSLLLCRNASNFYMFILCILQLH